MPAAARRPRRSSPGAAERGLTYRGSELLGSLEGLLPRFPDYVFNASQGELSGSPR